MIIFRRGGKIKKHHYWVVLRRSVPVLCSIKSSVQGRVTNNRVYGDSPISIRGLNAQSFTSAAHPEANESEGTVEQEKFVAEMVMPKGGREDGEDVTNERGSYAN